jgi:ketosteroid isomerase-like protein
MSKRNVELHRRFNEAFNTRDVEAFIALCDPHVEFHTLFAAVGGVVYHGNKELPRYFRDIADAWGDDLRVEPETFFDLGEQTLAFNVGHGRGRHSGAEVAMPFGQLVKWRNGVCVSYKAYARREDALRDLGVSEDELEPIEP